MTYDWKTSCQTVQAALIRRGRTAQEAEDIVQEASVRLVRYQNEREQPVQEPEGFLMRAALNLAVDAHRARMVRGVEVALEDVELVDKSPSVEARLLSKERLARLKVCLGRLTEKQRDIILLYRLEGLTYEEIAQRHGVSASTVEKHVAKASLRLLIGMEGW